MRAEELKGHLDALLLAALEGDLRHGYAVIEALRQDTGGRLDLPTGTIYPAPRRPGAGRADHRVMVRGSRKAAAMLPAHPSWPAGAGGPAGGVAGVRGHGQRGAGGR